MMRYFFYLLFSMMIFTLSLGATIADELMHIHKVTTAEMNAINNPQSGSLAYNTSENSLYFYTGTHWKKMRSNGSETKIVAGNCMDITGIGISSNPYIISDITPGKTQTTAVTTCKQILDMGCTVPDGKYWINPDGGSTSNAFQVYCDMTNDGGGWTLVFRHDVAGGFFANDAEADSSNESSPGLTTAKYSILNKIDSIKSASAYEFRLNYPTVNKRNHWKQTFDPRSGRSSSTPVLGYMAITIDSSTSGWGGLELDSSGSTFLDGTVNSAYWWYSIGSNRVYAGGMPGPSTVVSIVELFLR